MAKPPGSSGTPRETWMKDVEAALPRMKELVDQVDSPYRAAAFEKLFDIVLLDARQGLPAIVQPPAELAPSEPAIPATAGPVAPVGTPGAYERFLKDFGVTPAMVSNVLDLETGTILIRNLGSSAADRQRTVAVLLAVFNGYKTGMFAVSRDELTRVSTELDVYDPSNVNAYLGRTSYNGGLKVFVKADDGFKVPSPALGYLADVVKGSQPTPGGG